MQGRILVVEDDAVIGRALRQSLEADGYTVELAVTGADALASAARTVPDVVVLDLGLPDMDGLDVCRRLRAGSARMGIVMLTARAQEVQVVVGLDAGADDYLTKPFRLAELGARIRAQLRRSDASPDDRRLIAGDIEIDLSARRAYTGGCEIELRPKEFDLLALLAREAGRVVTRERAMSEVWDEHWFGSTKTLDMHISALRRKLGEDGPRPTRITTLRGVGYRLELR